MTSRDFTVQVRNADGSMQEVQRMLYFTHYGPMTTVPLLGDWSDVRALTYRDANGENDEVITQFRGMNLAQDMDDFQRVHAEVSGIPWVNTMSVSSDGRAWYADGSATTHLSEEAISLWEAAIAVNSVPRFFFDFGIVLLNGSDSRFEWVEEAGARDAGVVPYAKQPHLERRDAVSNANQSHWIANSAEPLEGYTPLMGGSATSNICVRGWWRAWSKMTARKGRRGPMACFRWRSFSRSTWSTGGFWLSCLLTRWSSGVATRIP